MFGSKGRKIKELENKVKELNADNMKLMHKLEVVLNLARKQTTKNTLLTRENDTLKKQIADLENALTANRQVNNLLKNKNSKLQKGNDALSEKIEHTKALHRNRQRKYRASKKENKAAGK